MQIFGNCCCHYQANNDAITYSKSIYRQRDNEVKPLLGSQTPKHHLKSNIPLETGQPLTCNLSSSSSPLPCSALSPHALVPSLETCPLPLPPSLAHALAPSNLHPPLGPPHPSLSNTDPLPPALSVLWSLLTSPPPPPPSLPF